MGAVRMNPLKSPPNGAGAGPVDVQVGKRTRARRLLLGMSMETLAKSLGVTFQQVQKYELGTNRVGPSRLVGTAKALRVPISYFFRDVHQDSGNAQTLPQAIVADLMERPETIRLYYAIGDETVRHQAMKIVKAIAEASARRPVALMWRRGRQSAQNAKK